MECTVMMFILVLGAFLVSGCHGVPTSSIDHLIVLVRHGERYPLFPVPEMGDFPVGGLTPTGVAEEIEFGKRMKATFPAHIPTCQSNRMKSADKERCIDTATAILSGMEVANYSTEVFTSLEINVKGEGIPTFLEKMKNFEANLPECVRKVLEIISQPMAAQLPANMVPVMRTFLASQVADSIDVLRSEGYTGLAYGLNISECVPANQTLFDDVTFETLVDFCMETICHSDTQVFLNELIEFAEAAFDPQTRDNVTKTLSVYGLNDVHILGLSKAILPGESHYRPEFGSYIIFAITGDDVYISTGLSVHSEPVHRATLNIYQIINNLQRTLA